MMQLTEDVTEKGNLGAPGRVGPVPAPQYGGDEAGSRSPMDLVLEFHRVFGLPWQSHPTNSIPDSLSNLRIDLLMEEVGEYASAVREGNLIEIADALADIVYVAYGAAATYGVDLDAVVAEVHRSNMSKLGPDGFPCVRDDGKVLKGPSYREPDIQRVLGSQPPLGLY